MNCAGSAGLLDLNRKNITVFSIKSVVFLQTNHVENLFNSFCFSKLDLFFNLASNSNLHCNKRTSFATYLKVKRTVAAAALVPSSVTSMRALCKAPPRLTLPSGARKDKSAVCWKRSPTPSFSSTCRLFKNVIERVLI